MVPDDQRSEGDVEVVVLEDDFLRAGARRRDTDRVGRCSTCSKSCSCSDEVCSASLEVERARDATHSAIALRTAPTGADVKSWNHSEELGDVQGGMRGQLPSELEATCSRSSAGHRRRPNETAGARSHGRCGSS